MLHFIAYISKHNIQYVKYIIRDKQIHVAAEIKDIRH